MQQERATFVCDLDPQACATGWSNNRASPAAVTEGAGAERAAAPRPPLDRSELIDILTDATAETTRLTCLEWSKAGQVQLRLTRVWLGRGGLSGQGKSRPAQLKR